MNSLFRKFSSFFNPFRHNRLVYAEVPKVQPETQGETVSAAPQQSSEDKTKTAEKGGQSFLERLKNSLVGRTELTAEEIKDINSKAQTFLQEWRAEVGDNPSESKMMEVYRKYNIPSTPDALSLQQGATWESVFISARLLDAYDSPRLGSLEQKAITAAVDNIKRTPRTPPTAIARK